MRWVRFCKHTGEEKTSAEEKVDHTKTVSQNLASGLPRQHHRSIQTSSFWAFFEFGYEFNHFKGLTKINTIESVTMCASTSKHVQH